MERWFNRAAHHRFGMLPTPHDELLSAAQTQLSDDLVDVAVDGVGRQAKNGGDFFGGWGHSAQQA